MFAVCIHQSSFAYQSCFNYGFYLMEGIFLHILTGQHDWGKYCKTRNPNDASVNYNEGIFTLFLWSIPLAIRQQISVDQGPPQSHWPRIWLQFEKHPGWDLRVPLLLLYSAGCFKALLFESSEFQYTEPFPQQATVIMIHIITITSQSLIK